MKSYRARITPRSAFGTPLKGDTLFGHICWAVRNAYGENKLTALLDGYVAGHPFVVVSDVMPANYLPRPLIPTHWFVLPENSDAKALKKRQWLPYKHFHTPVTQWLQFCRSLYDVDGVVSTEYPQPHNTLNRQTGTTGADKFAPYTMLQWWYGRKSEEHSGWQIDQRVFFDIYFVIDSDRLQPDEMRTLIAVIGEFGYGRDASIGLGKFSVISFEPVDLPSHESANSWLTLSPCTPQGLRWNESMCFYKPFTRFGRHGDIGVHIGGGKPFKAPILMADTGAVLTPMEFEHRLFIGQGLGGDGSLSKAISNTVHQGYAPVISIKLPA